MIRNYFLVAIRNLARNKIFSFINIIGLGLGMACSLLIMLWVQDEKSIDSFHKHKDSLYYVYEQQFFDGKIEAGYYTPGLLGPELKKKIPEIEMGVNYSEGDHLTFQKEDKILKETGSYSSADFFNMFSFPLLAGKATSALSDPSSMAISKKMATQFFGSPQAALGKTLRCENKTDFKVSAVFDDVPDNSSVKFDFLINWDYFLDQNSWAKDWGNNGPATLVMLRSDANPLQVSMKIRKFLDAYNKEQDKTFHIELAMQKFDQQYLHSDFKNGELVGGRIEYVNLFSIIAVFILMIACINFMNLTTARSVKRSKEIGVRKVIGAERGALIRQFIGESILIALLAAIAAFIIAAALLPVFNVLTEKSISFPFQNPLFWIEWIGLVLVTGLFSGSYPALYLSSFSPIRVLKGKMKFSTGALYFRKGLVIFQFTLSIALISGTMVVSRQVNYIQNKDLGFNRENLINLPIEGELRDKYTLFKDQALNIPGVISVTRMSETPTSISSLTGGVDWDAKDPNARPMFAQAAVGLDFVKAMGIEIAEGRDFSKDFATDSSGYLINESALRRIGYKNPIGKRLTFWGKKGTIVGVLKDFHFLTLRLPITPLILRLGDKDSYGTVVIKTEAAKTPGVLAKLELLYKNLNPQFPFSYTFSSEEFKKLYKTEQVIGKLSNYFAFLAIFISCLGLLGLAMFTAEQRTKEIGIRKVLGASIVRVFTLLSKEFLWLVAISFLISTPLSWWAMSQWLKDYTYRTDLSAWIFAGSGLLAAVIAFMTISFQATKAALANPVKSLRTE
jgi:putative ABC transport system permease protein